MAVQVKICGLTRREDALAVARAGADFAGLVLHPRSPRNVRPEQAAALAELLRGRVRVVALFADPSDDDLAEGVQAADPDLIQLHGDELPGRVAFVRAKFGKPVMKVLRIADDADFAPLAQFEAVTDMLMFDAKPPAHADYPGGHGRAFDWALLRRRTICRPWLLAGGLDAANVARAIESAGAPGVDVSSGVETSPGIKDADAIAAFVAAARAAEPAEKAQA